MALLFGSLPEADQPLRLRFLGLALLVSRVDHGLSGAQQQDEDRHSPTGHAIVRARYESPLTGGLERLLVETVLRIERAHDSHICQRPIGEHNSADDHYP